MKWLLDTCIISELVAQRPNPRVVDWVDSLQPDSIYLSVITIGEIRKGVEKLPDSGKRQAIHQWLTEDLLLRFKGRIVALDVDILITWGILTGNLEKQGRKMPAIDSFIAATTLHGDFILVTRNEEDFAASGVKIFNPWKG